MRRRKVTCIISGILFVGLLAVTPLVLADIYSWTDEHGVRHYSDTPPGDSRRVEVRPEVPYDSEADQRNRVAYQEMVRQVEEERRESENRELEERLKETEIKIKETERKAEQALDEAKEARNIAEEKQRRREVYVVPWIGPRGNKPQRPVPYDPYQKRSVSHQRGMSNTQ